MFLTGQLQFEPSFHPFLGFGFRGAMERDDLGDGAQTQPLAASESGSGVLVVGQSLAACLVQDEQPSAAASVGESYVVVDANGVDDSTAVTHVRQVIKRLDRWRAPSLWRVVVLKLHWWL